MEGETFCFPVPRNGPLSQRIRRERISWGVGNILEVSRKVDETGMACSLQKGWHQCIPGQPCEVEVRSQNSLWGLVSYRHWGQSQPGTWGSQWDQAAQCISEPRAATWGFLGSELDVTGGADRPWDAPREDWPSPRPRGLCLAW